MSNLTDVQHLLPRIALVATPPSDANLRLAKQMGATDIVGRYPAEDPASLDTLHARVSEAGLRVSVVEGYLPMPRIVAGAPGRDQDIDEIARLIERMDRLGIPVLCYNFMPTLDMTRTEYRVVDRGGALVNAFDADEAPRDAQPGPSAEALWANLAYFLERVVPVAEAHGVTLAMHPDDPPMPTYRGHSFIMFEPEAFERLVETVDSPSNAICFCQGCFSEMGVDVPAAIRRLGPKIAYAHFRDVRGVVPRFREAFHDDGQTDMYAAMRAYHEAGFRGAMRPDHVPRLEGEGGDASGYTMQGRLFAVGYMKGLMEGVASEIRRAASGAPS